MEVLLLLRGKHRYATGRERGCNERVRRRIGFTGVQRRAVDHALISVAAFDATRDCSRICRDLDSVLWCSWRGTQERTVEFNRVRILPLGSRHAERAGIYEHSQGRSCPTAVDYLGICNYKLVDRPFAYEHTRATRAARALLNREDQCVRV